MVKNLFSPPHRSERSQKNEFVKKVQDIGLKPTSQTCLTHYDLASDEDAPQWVKDAGESAYAELDKSSDIFDVWFESGSSWNAVMRERNLGYPAEVYIEGSDQHRGWFQLSLLPALGATGAPPFKTLLTHGFIVDAQGHKMSKSVGNTIDVEALLKKHGADVCRWWVSSLNYTNDIKADMKFFATAGEEYRKIRNTLRFMITNLSDFDVAEHRYEFTSEDANSIDAWALSAYDKVVRDVREAFDGFQVRKIRDSLFNFCNETLSRVYFSAIKDRLYCDATDSARRSTVADCALHNLRWPDETPCPSHCSYRR